jgi:hypothetical protein
MLRPQIPSPKPSQSTETIPVFQVAAVPITVSFSTPGNRPGERQKNFQSLFKLVPSRLPA